jgi:hypothetical protein
VQQERWFGCEEKLAGQDVYAPSAFVFSGCGLPVLLELDRYEAKGGYEEAEDSNDNIQLTDI